MQSARLKCIAVASMIAGISFSSMAMSATIEQLEQRLNAVEEELKLAQEEAADTSGKIRNALTVGGYADVEFVKTNDPATVGGFRMHHLSLMFKKQVSEKLKFFSEFEFEDGPWMDGTAGANAILVEAVNFDYAINNTTTARVGRFFTPAGIWSVDHYPPFVSTQDRPLHIRQIFPQLTDGASVTGNHAIGDSFLNYTLYVGNGETSDFNGKQDSNRDLATGLRVNFSLPFAQVFDIGATYYREMMNDPALASDAQPNKHAYGVHAKIKQGNLGMQAEYADGKYEPTQAIAPAPLPGPVYHRKGYYAQLSYDIDMWTVGYRYDFYDPDTTATLDNTKVNSLIVNYHVDKNTVLKWEHHLLNLEDPASKDYYRSIASVVVNFD